MKISISFKETHNNFHNIENTCISAYVKDGLLKVKDDNNCLHCYNLDIVEAYHIDFGDSSQKITG